MTNKRKRRVFQNSEPAYRAFLTKFGENNSFNDEYIILALDYAFREVFNSQISSDITRAHLVKVILNSKKKILEDLETLKDSPDSKIEPLKAKKQQSNSDINKMSKKRKLNSSSTNQEEVTVTSHFNKTNSNKKSIKRSSNRSKNSLTNSQIDEKGNQYAKITNKVLKVTIENNKNLQEIVKSCNSNSKNNKESKTKSFESGTKENSLHEHSRKINQKENEKLNVTQDHNKSIEIERSILRIDENNTSLLRVDSVSIKKEIDLLDTTLQGDIPIPLQKDSSETSQVISNNAALQEINNNQTSTSNSPLLSVSSQENVSSLNIACYNNYIPSVQSFNNCYQMAHINCYPCPFMHHHMVMNNQYGCCHGMYNFPMMNPFYSRCNHAIPPLQNGPQISPTNQDVENGTRTTNHLLSLQNGLQHQQTNQITENRPINQPLFLQNSLESTQANQIVENVSSMNTLQAVQINQMARNNLPHQPLNTAQEIAKLQTAIFNLNSQLDTLKNAWNQSQSN